MRWTAILLMLATLAACGVDGEPERPAPQEPTPMLAANVGYGASGLQANAAVGLTQGPLTLFVGI